MGASRIRVVGGAFVALCMVVGLAGCAAEELPPPEPSETVAEEVPDPSTTPEENPNEGVLFTITANVRATDGRTLGISMAAQTPLASTDPAAAELREVFLDQCGVGNGAQPFTEQYLRENGSTLMRIQLSSDTPGLTFAAPIDLFFGSPYFAQSATGEGISAAQGGDSCFYGYTWSSSGDALGIADFENPEGVPDVEQWKFGHYGFTVNPASGATIEACKVTITETGLAVGIADVPGWDPSLAATGISCGIGYRGE